MLLSCPLMFQMQLALCSVFSSMFCQGCCSIVVVLTWVGLLQLRILSQVCCVPSVAIWKATSIVYPKYEIFRNLEIIYQYPVEISETLISTMRTNVLGYSQLLYRGKMCLCTRVRSLVLENLTESFPCFIY